MHEFSHWIKTYGYLGVFTSLMLGMFGLPVPDESILTFTGFLISKDYLHPVPAVVAAFLGSICGITLNYLVGRFVGFPLMYRYGIYIRLTPAKLERAQQWFERYGKWALFIGYFLPGIRHLGALSAGASRLQYWIFAPFAYSGGFLWAATFITLGYFLGEEGVRIIPRMEAYLWEAAAGVLGLAGVAFLVRKISRLGRDG
jgi:membrane protein DedA with SNARE-associated domain